jgi:hypothetical protein
MLTLGALVAFGRVHAAHQFDGRDDDAVFGELVFAGGVVVVLGEGRARKAEKDRKRSAAHVGLRG